MATKASILATIIFCFNSSAADPEGKVALTAIVAEGDGSVEVVSNRKGFYPANLYDVGTTLTIVARPNPGSAFTGWSGDATGTENPLTVKLTESKLIRAHFKLGFSLTVNSTDGGTVTKTPNAAVYMSNAVVLLQATSLPGFAFAGWTGAASGEDNPIALKLTSNTVVNARFMAPPWIPVWTQLGAANHVAADSGNLYFETDRVMSIRSNGDPRWVRPLREIGNYSENITIALKSIAVDPGGNVRYAIATGNQFSPTDKAGAILTLSSAGITPPQPEIHFTDRIVQDLSIGHDSALYSDVFRWDPTNPDLGDELIATAGNATDKWIFRALTTQTGHQFSENLTRPAIGLDGTLYLSGRRTTNSIYALGPDGSPLWRMEIEQGAVNKSAGRVILGDNVGYVVEGDGTLLAFNLDGTPRWRFDPGEPLGTPSIGAGGIIYTGSAESSRFYAINPDGTARWVTKPGFGPYTEPAIDANGMIYVADGFSLIAMNSNGEKVKEIAVAGGKAPVHDGAQLYIAGGVGLYAFEAPGGIANSPWPMRNANPQNSAAVRSVMPAPTLRASVSATTFKIIVATIPGATVSIHESADLEHWSFLTSELTSTGEFTLHVSRGAAQKFYRVSAVRF